MPLQADLETALGQPVALANDANCLALSEATDGAGAGAAVVFAAILGTGAGAGIAVHGRVLQGPHRLAGEWGHNPLPWAEPARDPVFDCYCGQRGCIETLVSGSGLARDHAHVDRPGADRRGDRAPCRRRRCRLPRHAGPPRPTPGAGAGRGDQPAGPGRDRARRRPVAPARTCTSRCRRCGADGSSAPTAIPVRTRLLPARHGDASGVRGAAWIGRARAGGEVEGAVAARHRPPPVRRSGVLGDQRLGGGQQRLALEAALVHVGDPFVVDGAGELDELLRLFGA